MDIYGAGSGMEKVKSMLKGLGFVNEEFPGESHLVGITSGQPYNYLGPGSRLDIREKAQPKYALPINELDSAAMKHDYAYKTINEMKLPKEEFKKEINDADQQFLNDIKHIHGVDKQIAEKAMKLKGLAERKGLISFAEFSGTGMYFKPNHMFKKEERMGKPQNGGFLPMLSSLAVPFISSLAPYMLDKVIKAFKKEDKKAAQVGNGYEIPKSIKGMSDEAKKIYIANMLDNMPIEKQLDILIIGYE